MSGHIAVNTRLLLTGRLEGISRFAYEVLKRMALRNPDVRFSYFFDRPFDSRFVFSDNVEAYVLPPQARHPVLWYLWFHQSAAAQIRALRPDLFFSPEFYLTSHPSIPQVSVIHDLAYEHYPKDIPWMASWYCRHYSPLYARKAAHILTVSEFSKNDIMQRYQIEQNRISVVHNGASRSFFPIDELAQVQIRRKYTEGDPYFHFVGSIHPRKNVENLLRAFDLFKQTVSSPVKLLLVGRRGWHYEGAMRTFELMAHKDDVRFTGFVSDEELNRIYASSLGLVYVPYLEGFGIPILEAMHSETAVICSNITSMPEVAGDAALQVNPLEIGEIAGAMLKIYRNPLIRKDLIARGRIQRERFSWDITYERVWEVLSRYLPGMS
jgi:glycosyltransferase involved in cell wall biosynthesis